MNSKNLRVHITRADWTLASRMNTSGMKVWISVAFIEKAKHHNMPLSQKGIGKMQTLKENLPHIEPHIKLR